MDHLCNAVESALSTSNWYAALMVALALPDIAARVDDPTKPSSARYVEWVETYLCPHYTRPVAGHVHKFLSGGDCYALRCAFVHEGGDDVTHHRAAKALDKFQLLAPRPGLRVHCNQTNNKLQLQVDIFCRDILAATRAWRASITPADTVRLDRLKNLAVIQVGGVIAV
jgi:hypothetical protein